MRLQRVRHNWATFNLKIYFIFVLEAAWEKLNILRDLRESGHRGRALNLPEPPSRASSSNLSWAGLRRLNHMLLFHLKGFLCDSAGKESTCNVGHLGSIPELGRSPGEGEGYPLQYPGLENSMDYTVHTVHTVHGVAKSRTWLSDFHFHLFIPTSPLAPGSHLSFHCLHSFAFPRMSYSENHIVGSLFRLASFTCMCLVAQSYLILWDTMNCSPLGSSVHEDSPVRILEWVTMSSSSGSSQLRDRTQVSQISGRFFTSWAIREALLSLRIRHFRFLHVFSWLDSSFIVRVG